MTTWPPADTAQVSIPTQRGVGRPALTSATELKVAARRIGFADLTVGRVTSRAGVKFSTFYRHWPSLEALTTALIDDVLAEHDIPDHQPWRTQLEATAATLRAVLDAHPGMAAALAGVNEPDWLVRARERCADRMLTAGMPGGLVTSGVATVLLLAASPQPVDEQAVGIVLDGIDARGRGAMSDDWVRCANCQFPLGPDERALDRRVCDECVEDYAIDEQEAQG